MSRGAHEIPDRPFIVVSGLPGSGKSLLAGRLAVPLSLPVIDKDEILERLFKLKGTGDAAHRRMLSRESDLIFQEEAKGSEGALLVSFWHSVGMASDSGTPTNWLPRLSRRLVNLHCNCPPEIAAARFLNRKRHPSHLDGERSAEQILADIRGVADLRPPDIGRRIEIDTSKDFDVDTLAGSIVAALAEPWNG